jgi:hypothetical protein
MVRESLILGEIGDVQEITFTDSRRTCGASRQIGKVRR